ncbi:uncharacterized protein YdhG (YjbR/CyaY superfamily) [Roseivirga pacifica]|uniref:Uncharacterized conserved protein YdhG, YjbR/CyaY-like superfamily, DUF1801 family n=1 Tax=Roseivirga pacifica TaxID=1267423 RepID=A0A1I0QS19_9BACT|nr:DUF1801 domain-containing protein [Roseivirga pacifica]RKQ42654.1 uncharacterized protein YdhG (YjbR/CyaY superfamily) [Roseivirga pacifica]SEW30003.1 Uncharacterized conserved protein YdhG, YjbR/CyaY-like superfamily, DUF1801 family [Roseivirga pacifica]
MQTNNATNFDEYIVAFPAEVQKKLIELRTAIREEAPKAEETISYMIPTFKYNGALVHFAAYKKHIGFYPAPSGIAVYEEELKPYKYAKGSVQFPLNKPLPIELIKRIVRFRVKENEAKSN